ncbi:MAG: queuosine precursor transporter [Bacteroidetes bacterium]|nr:queuosine precursor transporter [Bacteroidota bacterium]
MKKSQIDRKTKLYILLGCFFLTNAIVAEFIGSKIFSMELSLGFSQFDWNFFGVEGLSFDMTCGVILWPFVFVMTDIINEYYGKDGVKRLSYIASGMIAYAFIVVFLAIQSVPAPWWIESGVEQQVPNMQNAYNKVFGQGLWIIIGSLVAFLFGQFVDVYVFHWIKKASGDKYLWLRSTGSTLVSQFIDSFIVLFIAFYIGSNWNFEKVLAIGLMNYIFKFIVAILLTPLLYLLHNLIDNYLGKDKAEKIDSSGGQTI